MALDWDNIIIETDEYSYSLDAEQRMILFAGNKGDKGDPGNPGEAATITIGTVTTLAAGSPATVENVGTSTDARFNFGIPQGPKGDPGSGGAGAWGAITGTLSDQTDLQDALDAKQNTLTFDSTPTNGSSNPVTSDGIYDALATKQSTLTFDSAPTASSTNPVTSDGIKTALDAKANNSILADDFSPSTTYAIGDYCIAYDALYRFTSAHTGNWAWADVTQVVAMNELAALSAQVASRRKFEVSGTASAGSSVTITDSRINDEHWQVPKNGIWFSDSSKVTTQVHWVTNITNHTLTLEATFTGATNVKVDLDWYQDVQSA